MRHPPRRRQSCARTRCSTASPSTRGGLGDPIKLLLAGRRGGPPLHPHVRFPLGDVVGGAARPGPCPVAAVCCRGRRLHLLRDRGGHQRDGQDSRGDGQEQQLAEIPLNEGDGVRHVAPQFERFGPATCVAVGDVRPSARSHPPEVISVTRPN